MDMKNFAQIADKQTKEVAFRLKILFMIFLMGYSILMQSFGIR